MNKLKTLFVIVLAALIIASIGASRCEAAGGGGGRTRILSLWWRIKGNRTCLTFDAEGARPQRIGPASDVGISVFFSRMTVGFGDRSFKGGKVAVKEVKFRRGSSFLEVFFRWKNTSATYSVRAERHGRYALTLFLTPPSVKTPVPAHCNEPKPVDFIENGEGAIVSPVNVGKVHTSELFGSAVSPQEKAALAQGPKPAESGEPAQAQGVKPAAAAFVEPDPKGLALYKRANEKFEDCSPGLIFCASDIIKDYRAALQAGPRSSQAPLAVYRCGLAYYLMGKYRRADQFFKTVTSQWPDSGLACRSWIGAGNISMKQGAYIEAMEAYRWAQREASTKGDKAAADYAVGKIYHILGADKEALAALQDCLAQAPDYYLKTPRVFRYIGEADFGLGDFDNAKQMLLRYVNYQESDPDQGIILAKIGEIFLKEGQVDEAKKIYGYVHKYYTNSEGDIICQIRSAELMENVNLKKAIEMYDSLKDMDLSPSLRNIVLLKLAELELKNCDLAQGLMLLDQSFPIKGDGASPPGIAELRQRFFCDLIRQYYSDKDYGKAIHLVDRYRAVYNSVNSPETLEEIAESYAAQRSYFKALQTYDRLLAQQHGKNLDGILLRCAVYALRLQDYNRAQQYAQEAQSGALELKKSEILGQIFCRDQQYAKAVGCFGKVLQQRDQFYLTDPDSYRAFGYSLYELKQYEQAAPILQKALLEATTTNNTRESILVTLSDCLKEQKNYANAAALMEAAIQMAVGEEKNELLYRVSKLYLKEGKPELAVARLNQMKASQDSFWSAVAEQELNTITMAAQGGGSKR